MFPVKIYVVHTPPRLIFGPNLSDTLIILPTHTDCILYPADRNFRLEDPHRMVFMYLKLMNFMILTCVNVSMLLHV